MIRKLLFCFLVASVAMIAKPTGEYLEAFNKQYSPKADSPLATKSCGSCHVSDSDFAFNSYGEAVKAKMKELGAASVDAAVLTALEAGDADGDGTSNKDEITAGNLPGDPAVGGKPGVKVEAKPKAPESVIPKNAFHPAIVHFPIALFIAGLILDALGMFKNDKTLLLAGWYNLIFAALSAFGGIGSGVMAMVFKGYPIAGKVQTHLILAVISTLLMWGMVAMRVHRHEKMEVGHRVLYYLLAATAFFLISWAGHVGGDLVYG